MNADTVKKLLVVNRQFYQSLAQPFAATRQRLQPGVQRILAQISPQDCLLDLGCGNGELALALARQGHRRVYIGLDFSPELIAIARQRAGSTPGHNFVQADLSTPDWPQQLEAWIRTGTGPDLDAQHPDDRLQFDGVFAFAVLHHLPGAKLRLRTLQHVHSLLAPHGRFVHSEWQFLNSPRLRRRIVPWEAIGVSAQEVDQGDYLLDWRHEQYGLRYVHFFDEAELSALAESAGFGVQDTFYADGEGGKLGLYQIWKPARE